MEAITLIDVARSWIYNPKRRRENKWEPRDKTSIVRLFPRFLSTPSHELDKWVDFFLSKLLLYKPFYDIE